MRRGLVATVIMSVCFISAKPALAQEGGVSPTPFQQAVALRQQGQFEEAATAFRRIVENQPNHDRAWLNLGLCAHQQQDYERALQGYAKAATFLRTRPTALYNSACANALLGRTEPALEALQAAIEAGFSNASLVRSDADLESIRADERFATIIESIGLPPSQALHFWIGEWDCYNAQSGRLSGKNELVARLNGSVIHENWTDTHDGSRGESWNYYAPATRTWHQHWVNDRGQPFVYVGKPRDNGIMFEAPAPEDATGAAERQRMFVRPIGNGRVQQTGTKSTDGGETWSTMFDLVYVPRGEAYNADDPTTATARPGDPARQFDFLIGSWRMDVEQYDPEGKLVRSMSEWCRVQPMNNGTSLIDDWNGQGFTVRTYSPKTRTWRLYWTADGPSVGGMQFWEGTFEDGVGTFIGGYALPHGNKGVSSKIEFSEITPKSCLWKMWKTPDGGETWVLDYIRRYTRITD